MNLIPPKPRLKGTVTKPPRPNVVRKEAYRVFIAEYGRNLEVIRNHLNKQGIVLNSIENVMKAVRVLDAKKLLEG